MMRPSLLVCVLGLSSILMVACTTLQRPGVPARIVQREEIGSVHETRFNPLETGSVEGVTQTHPVTHTAAVVRIPPASETLTAESHDEAGMADFYYKKGDYKRSIALLSDAVAKDETNAGLWRNLGSAYAMDSDFDNAVTCFESALKRNQIDTKSYYDLSVVQGWKGSLPQAESAAKKGLVLEPTHGGLHSSLGNVYDDEGHPDLAFQEYAAALKINPNDTVTRFNRGGLHFKRKELGDAESDFNRVLKLAPKDLEAAQNLAAVYIVQNRLTEAETLNQWVLRQKPKDEDTLENAYFNLGIIYDRRNKVEHALNMYQLALQVAPWDAAAYVNAAVILERLNRRSEALAYWEKYQRLFPASRRVGEISKRIDILRKLVALEKEGHSAPNKPLEKNHGS